MKCDAMPLVYIRILVAGLAQVTYRQIKRCHTVPPKMYETNPVPPSRILDRAERSESEGSS